MMIWSDCGLLTDAFEQARGVWTAMFPGRRRVGRTYQGFARRWPSCCERVLPGIQAQLRRRMDEMAAAGDWLIQGFRCLAVDGSKFDLPRTASNEDWFGVAGVAGRAGTHPQALATLLWDLSSGVIWDWRIGPVRDSERGQLRRMIDTLPSRTLLIGDAGFPGYDLLRELLGSGHHVLMRVGGNVRLLRKLGCTARQRQGLVYLWPEDKRDAEPIVLRLVKLHDGRQAAYVITSVLDPSVLSDVAVARLYARRWGVEVQYRTLKQTLDQRKMRSGAGATAHAELQAAILGAWLLGLLGVKALLDAGKDPTRLSPAGVLRVLRQHLREPWARRRGKTLRVRLRGAVVDGYRRTASKASRHYPRKKSDPPPQSPKIRDATPQERQHAQQLMSQNRSGALTA